MKKRILLLLAHPDDETFGPGGTVAKYADKGAEITLATATRGEMGMLGDPPFTDRARVGEVRSGELMCAAKLLGIGNVRFLGFLDGQLASIPRDTIVEKAVEQIRRGRPHVMIGFGPEGVSRHTDHMVMCSVALEAFDAAADPRRFPQQLGDGLLPWAPYKLYQFEIAQEVLDEWGVPLAGVPRTKLTTTVDTSSYVEKKIEAFYCHKTQAKDYKRILSREGYREFCRSETYVLAKSRLPPGPLPESDLFAGIPPEEPGAP
jgi:LmbE family N-acetylglucosaminyl deacetylase